MLEDVLDAAERGPRACRPARRHGRSGRDIARRPLRRAHRRARARGMAIPAPSRPPRACLSARARRAMMTHARRHSARVAQPRSPRRLRRTGAAPSFTIVPAHDDLGSNTIVCSPPDAVPLRFGEDSFYPASRRGASAWDRPARRAPPGDRDGYRQSRRSRRVSQNVAARADPDARLPRTIGRRRPPSGELS